MTSVEIYRWNFKEMFKAFKEAIKIYPIIVVDTEFSGFSERKSVFTSTYDIYELREHNIDLARLIHVGFIIQCK